MGFVQGNAGGTAHNANVSSLGVAFPVANVLGNCIVVDIMWELAAASTGSVAVTDSAGNTYSQVFSIVDTSILGSGQIATCWIAENCKAGANTVTLTYTTATGPAYLADCSMAIHEYANVARVGAAVDAYATQWTSDGAFNYVPTTYPTDTIHSFFAYSFASAHGLFLPNPFKVIGITDPLINQSAQALRETCAAGIFINVASYDLSVSNTGNFVIAGSLTFSIGIRCFLGIVALKVPPSPLSPGNAWLIINEPAAVNPTPGYTDRSGFANNGGGIFLGKSKSKLKFTNTLQQRGNATIPLFLKAANTYDPTLIEGCQVFQYDLAPGPTSTLVWAGTIEKVNLESVGLKGDRIATLTAVSFRQAFDKLRVPPQLFQQQSGGAIFTSLFNSVAGGVPVTLGAIVGSGSGPSGTGANFVIATLDLASSPFPKLSDVYDQIAQACGCVWDIDLPTLTVYLKPPDTTASPYSIAPKQLLYDSVTYQQDRADYRNWQAIQISASAFGQSSELFAASFPSSTPLSFTLKHPAQTITKAWLTNNTQNHATGTFSSLPANGDTITIGYPQSGSIYNWAPNAPYTVDQIIVDPLLHIQICKTQGTSGGTQPSWNDTGGTTTDGPGSPQQSGFGGAVIWQDLGVSGPGGVGTNVYTMVDVLDNTEWGQVLIPATGSIDQMCQNFADAINSNSAVQGGISGSPTFSAPTWENPLVNAGATSGGAVITIFNKAAGAGYKAALSTTSSAFSWSAAQTSGGTTTQNTKELQIAQNGQSNSANLYWTPGSNVVALASDPQTAHTNFIQIQYQAAGSDFIVVENSAEVLRRAAIENGNGLYMQSISQTSITSNTQALQFVRAILAAYDSVPVSLSFTTYKPGLLPGQLLTVGITIPSYLAALLNGTWFIQEVSAELVPLANVGGVGGARWMQQTTAPGGGHFRWTVTLINESQVQSWLAFWEQMAGGGGGGGSAGLVAGGSASPDDNGGGTLTAGAASYSIVVATGPPLAAIPLLLSSGIQHIVLTGNTNLTQPSGLPAGSFGWTLVVDNPSGTPYALIPDGTYGLSSGIVVDPGTRTTIACMTTQSGNTMLGPIWANQGINTL
jgi:hypothetical protein